MESKKVTTKKADGSNTFLDSTESHQQEKISIDVAKTTLEELRKRHIPYRVAFDYGARKLLDDAETQAIKVLQNQMEIQTKDLKLLKQLFLDQERTKTAFKQAINDLKATIESLKEKNMEN